jgi:hypothetical protein
MLFIVILVEVLFIAGVAVAVLRDDKKLRSDFNNWLGTPHKQVYRIPLVLIVREEIKSRVGERTERSPKVVQSTAKHRYVHP